MDPVCFSIRCGSKLEKSKRGGRHSKFQIVHLAFGRFASEVLLHRLEIIDFAGLSAVGIITT